MKFTIPTVEKCCCCSLRTGSFVIAVMMMVTALLNIEAVFLLTRAEATGDDTLPVTVTEKAVALVLAMLFVLNSWLIVIALLLVDASIVEFATMLTLFLWLFNILYLVTLFIVHGILEPKEPTQLVIQCVKFIYTMLFLYYVVILHSYSIQLEGIQSNTANVEEDERAKD
ncbi:uncharacterized protein LOC128982691 [Macrosteles quadrilineatus]|uniref:uncharacterized protein LOC128982691 n=1 Tax=Macrosteles quadrilineatus TaxID=74068 RepID=UPI0023E22FEC|nr:uncharacterized protein LOC128982691 [Macrosteles quadrilineatus]